MISEENGAKSPVQTNYFGVLENLIQSAVAYFLIINTFESKIFIITVTK